MRTRRNYATPDFQSTSKEDLQRFSSSHAKSAADSANSVIPDLVKLFEQDRVMGATLAANVSLLGQYGSTLSANTSLLSTGLGQYTSFGVTLNWSSASFAVGVTHTLGGTALGYLVGHQSSFGSITRGYRGLTASAWTSNYCDLYWDSNGAGVSSMYAYILFFK